MLAEYARLIQGLFPSIDPNAAKQLIAAAGASGFSDEQYFATQLGDKLCQGDVVEGLRWIVEREDGSYVRKAESGILLSHSCDVDNTEWLTFASCVPFDSKLGNANSIKRQEVTELYYLPAHGTRSSMVADLAQLQSRRAAGVLSGIADGSLHRVDSLTQLGHYHFIAKLTIHLLRPQSLDEIRYQSAAPLVDRMIYAGRSILGLMHYVARGSSSPANGT
jgi:hypothetical protein